LTPSHISSARTATQLPLLTCSTRITLRACLKLHKTHNFQHIGGIIWPKKEGGGGASNKINADRQQQQHWPQICNVISWQKTTIKDICQRRWAHIL